MPRLKQITTILRELVAIPSISSNFEACKETIDYVDQIFKQTSYKVRRYQSNHVHSIIISHEPSFNFELLFLGHLDVVSAPPEAFKPAEIDGWLYGRGTADMKGGCVSMIQLFLDHELDPNFEDFALIFTTDEEVGGLNGVRYLIEEHGLTARTVFNPDGGSHFAPCKGEKGILEFRLESMGSSAHGAQPWTGVNAIELLIDDIGRVQRCYDYARLGDEWQISLNLGTISGGQSTNSVPAHAQATIDIRFPAPINGREVLRKIRSSIKTCRLTVILEAEPVTISEDNPELTALYQALDQLGYPKKSHRNFGASDARWFVPQGSNLLLMLPESTKFHVDNEGVDLQSLVSLVEVLERFVEIRTK